MKTLRSGATSEQEQYRSKFSRFFWCFMIVLLGWLLLWYVVRGQQYLPARLTLVVAFHFSLIMHVLRDIACYVQINHKFTN